jgi:XXXCH domain-containing protein
MTDRSSMSVDSSAFSGCRRGISYYAPSAAILPAANGVAMKNLELTRLKRQDLGAYLIGLGKQILQGAIQAEGRSWPVPGEVEAEIHLKEKKGRFTAKLKWQWSTLAEYDKPALREVQDWQSSFKMVKARLSSAFKELQQQASQGQLPSEAAVLSFVESSEALANLAEPEWQGAMQEYLDHLHNLQMAVTNRQLELVSHELRDLAARMVSCHREFK